MTKASATAAAPVSPTEAELEILRVLWSFGQAPPAGPQWVSRLAPLEPQALAYASRCARRSMGSRCTRRRGRALWTRRA